METTASEIYQASGVKRFLFGSHYREAWTTPVQVPVLDLADEKGGLEIVRKGGGRQTKSLHLKDAEGNRYVLRSVQKDTSGLLPEHLRGSVIDDIFQDQISAGHPYGAFIIPDLAEAAGVLHTSPKLVYIPDSPLLGTHREEFDQAAFARARLFDMLIGDWDRHGDQWRWAEYEKEGKGEVYRPIPRDRDNAFYEFDGVIPWIARRKFLFRPLQKFDHQIHDLPGLNWEARCIDRFMLTELTMEDWVSIARDLKAAMTDEIIENAVGQWPPAIYRLDVDLQLPF